MALCFSPWAAAEDFLWVELLAEDRQWLHFVDPSPSPSADFYYAARFEQQGRCPAFDAQAQSLKAAGDGAKKYLPPQAGGYLCVVGSGKPLKMEWRPYQIVPEQNSLLDDEEDDIRSVSDDSGDVLPERHKKQCVFDVDAEKGIKFCTLSLW